jgi:hypothetical protein
MSHTGQNTVRDRVHGVVLVGGGGGGMGKGRGGGRVLWQTAKEGRVCDQRGGSRGNQIGFFVLLQIVEKIPF